MTTLWFYNWCQDNTYSDWESISTALKKRFKDSYCSHIFERLTAMNQVQTEMESLSEEGDSHLTDQDKIALREVGQNALKQKQVLGQERWNYPYLMEVYRRETD